MNEHIENSRTTGRHASAWGAHTPPRNRHWVGWVIIFVALGLLVAAVRGCA